MHKQGGGGGGRIQAIVYDWLKLLEEGKEICATFFDYQKAFDSVPHHPLMEKLLSLDIPTSPDGYPIISLVDHSRL